jgi:mRNA interferase MazF
MGRTAGRANENRRIVLSLPGLHSVLLHDLYIGGFCRLISKGRSNTMNKTYLRGDMYYADLGRGIGSEQEGYRPVVIIQNNTGNKYSPTVIVATISSKVDAKAKLPTHYLLKAESGLELPSLVLLEQLRTIDKKRLEAYIGRLEEKHIRRINHALAVSVGLIEEVPENLIMCLCPACANNFYGTGSYYLRRVNSAQRERDICTYCGQRPGFDYEVVRRKDQ